MKDLLYLLWCILHLKQCTNDLQFLDSMVPSTAELLPSRRVSKSAREIELLREQLIESMMKLAEEVGQLWSQLDVLTQEIATMQKENRRFHEERETEFSHLQVEEY